MLIVLLGSSRAALSTCSFDHLNPVDTLVYETVSSSFEAGVRCPRFEEGLRLDIVATARDAEAADFRVLRGLGISAGGERKALFEGFYNDETIKFPLYFILIEAVRVVNTSSPVGISAQKDVCARTHRGWGLQSGPKRVIF